MKLTVLGGSHASVNPGAGSSGYLVQHHQTSIAVDLGPNTVLELRKHTDHRLLDAVVITHPHIDHFLDVITLRLAINYNRIKVNRTIPLYLPPGAESLLRAIVQPIATADGYDDYFECFQITEYDPIQRLVIGSFTLSFAPTVHSVTGWAVRFAGEGDTRDLVFSSDTGSTANLSSFVSGAHVFVCEATYGIDPKLEMQRDIRFHMTLGEAVRLASESGVSTLVLTHTMDELDRSTYVQVAEESFAGPVYLGLPGLIIDWED